MTAGKFQRHTDKDKSDKLVNIVRWRCLTCGQQHFTPAGQEPPDICEYCNDMTTWERLEPNPNGNHHNH